MRNTKKLLAIILAWSPVALAAGPGANCPASVTLGFKNIVDGGAVFCDGGNFCDGGAIGQYFEAVCNLNNPIAMASSTTFFNIVDGGATFCDGGNFCDGGATATLVWADMGTSDGGLFNDGLIQSIPVDGGLIKNISPATEGCPISISADGINVVWVNAGSACAFTDGGIDAGGATASNGLWDVPVDGGTVVNLVAGDQGIRKVVSDGTFAYISVENQAINGVLIGAIQAVLLDAGAGYPVTTLWSANSGTATLPQGQACSWSAGLFNCPAMGIANTPLFNTAGPITVSNGILYWGPGGMSLNIDAGSVPQLWGAACPAPGAPGKDAFAGFDAGVLSQAGTGILNGQCQWLANNTENAYHPIATDQTTVFYPCNSNPNGTVGMCSVPANQSTAFLVQIGGETVAPGGGTATNFGDVLQSPAVIPGSLILSFSSANQFVNFALDNDAGVLDATSNVIPSGQNLPNFLDGGVSYGDGGIRFYLSGTVPSGWSVTANYTGTQNIRNPAVPTVIIPSTLPGISGEVLDALGNLDFVTPTGIDAGGIWILQPK